MYHNESSLSSESGDNYSGELTSKSSTPSAPSLLQNSTELDELVNSQLFQQLLLESTINNSKCAKIDKSNENLYSLVDIIRTLSTTNIDSQQLMTLLTTADLTKVNKFDQEKRKNCFQQLFNESKTWKNAEQLAQFTKFQQDYSDIVAAATTAASSSSTVFNNINNNFTQLYNDEQQQQQDIQAFNKLPLFLELPSTSATKVDNKRMIKKLKSMNNSKNCKAFSLKNCRRIMSQQDFHTNRNTSNQWNLIENDDNNIIKSSSSNIEFNTPFLFQFKNDDNSYMSKFIKKNFFYKKMQ